MFYLEFLQTCTHKFEKISNFPKINSFSMQVYFLYATPSGIKTVKYFWQRILVSNSENILNSHFFPISDPNRLTGNHR